MWMRERELPATRTGDYLAFRPSVVADLGQRLSIEKHDRRDAGAAPRHESRRLDESARRVQNGNFPLAVQMLKRAAKSSQAQIRPGTSRLATWPCAIMMMLSPVPEGVDVNPYDEFAS